MCTSGLSACFEVADDAAPQLGVTCIRGVEADAVDEIAIAAQQAFGDALWFRNDSEGVEHVGNLFFKVVIILVNSDGIV